MSHRLRWPLGLVTALLALAIALWPATAEPPPLAAIVGSAITAKTALPDPLPIRRTFVPQDRLEGLLAIAGRDQFLKMPREEFEAQVQSAAREQFTEKFPPQLVEAKYRAQLINGRLVGTGQWNLKNPTGRPAAVLLEPLGPAIRDAKWTTGKAAFLFRGTLNGRATPGTYLWADDPAGGTIDFAWSLRGLDEPEEERYEIAFPTSAIAHFELIAPAERIPTLATGGGFLTGPFPADAPADRLWKFSLGGQSRIDLVVRRPHPTDKTSAVVLNRTARWNINASERTGSIELTMESSRGSSRQRSFTLDPGLLVNEVTGSNVESWSAVGPNLSVQIRETLGATKVLVQCESPQPVANAWLCPTIHLPGALLGNDLIEFTCAPEVKLESWLPGDYRTKAVTVDGNTKLVFTGAPLPAFGEDRSERRMPTLRYRTTEGEFRTEESLIWKVEPGRNTLSAVLKLTVLQGPLASLNIQTSPGYIPTSVNTQPDDPGLTWAAVPGAANTWMIEPSKAIASGKAVEFRIEVRGAAFPRLGNPANASPEALSLPFPRLRPLGASARQLSFSGNAGAGLHATYATSATETKRDGAFFSAIFRNRDAEGDLVIATIPPRLVGALDATMSSRDENRIAVTATFHGRIDRAAAAGVTLFAPGDSEPKLTLDGLPANAKRASPPDGWNWLPIAGARSGWQALGTAALLARPSGSFWFVPFARPLLGDFELRVEYAIPAGAGLQALPLPSLGGCAISDFKASLDQLLAEKYQPPISASNCEAILVPRNGSPRVTIEKASDWRLADVQLRTTVDAEGRLACSLRGRVVELGGPILEIQHPTNFEQLKSVSVGSHEVPLPVGRQRDTVRVPIAAGETFEIRYRLPSRVSPVPQIPGAASVEQIWHTTGEYLWWPSLSAADSSENRADTRRIVRAEELRVAGYAFAAILLAFGWYRLFQPRHRSSDLLCIAIALALGLAEWIDTEGWRLILRPALIASVFLLAGNFLRAGRGVPSQATAAILCLFAVAQAQAPEPVSVYFVPGENGAMTAYAPKTLMAKLESLAKPPMPSAIFSNAEYAVNAGKEFATIEATFQFQCQQDGEQVIELPLMGVRLEWAKLDNAAAFLDGSKPDRFGVPVRTAGAHILQVRFAVPIAVADNDREVRYGAPDVPSCQVTFQASLRGRQIEVASRRGGQTVGLTREGLKAVADHGSGKVIHLRWREDGTAEGAKPSVNVREIGIWDLGETESVCTSGFLYRIQGGTLAQLKFECPEGLEPMKLEVKTTDARPQTLGVKSWTVGPAANGSLPITVKLQNAVDGRIAVVMTARPRKLLTVRPALKCPRSTDANDGERDSFFALRTTGLTIDAIISAGTVEIPADALTKDFAGWPELNLEKAPLRVLRRTSNASVELKPVLSLPHATTGGSLSIAYTLGRRIEAEGHLQAVLKEGGILEFDLPAAMKLYDVTGPSLAGWGRTGNRVQLWFKQGTVGEIEVSFHGALNFDLLSPVAKPSEGMIDLPLPRWPTTGPQPGKPFALSVRIADGWDAAATSLVGFKNAGMLPPAPRRWEYVADAPPGQVPQAKFSLKPAEAKPAPMAIPLQPSEAKSIPTRPSDSTVDPSLPAIPQPRTRDWLPGFGATAWLFGIVAVARLPTRRWPERVGLLGLLGATALGVFSLGGLLMLGLAAFGLVARLRKFVG